MEQARNADGKGDTKDDDYENGGQNEHDVHDGRGHILRRIRLQHNRFSLLCDNPNVRYLCAEMGN